MRLRRVGQSSGFKLEPLINPILRGNILVNITRLVTQIQHHIVAHGLIVLIGMDIRSKGLDTPLLVSLEQRRPGKADQHCARQHSLHRLVEFPGLGAVTLIYKDEYLALCTKPFRQVAADVLDECVNITFLRRTKLVDQRTDQPLVASIEHMHQISAATRTINIFTNAFENLFDLFIQFRAIGDD